MAHVTDQEIEELLNGTLPPRDRRRLVRHLIAEPGCRECGPRIFAALRRSTDPPALNEASYLKAVGRTIRKLRRLARRRQAGEDRRESQIRTIPLWDRVEALLQHSREARDRDPVWMLDLARQAQELADKIETTPYGQAFLHDLRTRTWIELANAQRVNRRYGEAESSILFARSLREDGSGDPLLYARLKEVEGSLRKDQKRLPEAEALFDSALRIYRKIGEHDLGQGRFRRRRDG